MNRFFKREKIVFNLILLLFFSFLSACVKQNSTTEPKKPNIVFILADDQRYDMLSCNGNPYVQTPNLDRLAEEGCNFTQAFTVSGVCSPSRAVFFTGKYAHQCRAPQIIWDNHSFRMEETPFPEILHKEGYYSAHIGKWHLGEGQKQKAGYDFWAGFEWLGSFFNTRLTINGEEKEFEGYSDDILSKLAAEKILELSDNPDPFCLFVGLKAPHLPFSYPERYADYLEDKNIPPPASMDEDYDESGRAPIMKTNVIRIRTFAGGIPMFGSWDKYIKSYYRSSQALDDAVGNILNAIDEAGIQKETLVIYSSDQGYTLGEHGMTEKHYAYEQVMRIPMIVRYPELIKPGTQSDKLVLNMDVAPTVLDLCGINLPTDMSGKSWKPLFEGSDSKNLSWREDFLFEYWDYRPTLPSQLAVRSEDYKFISYQNHPEKELYDLQNDPDENQNVANNPEYKEALSDMEKRLSRLINETGWSQRRFQPVNNCYALGPFSEEKMGKLRKTVFSVDFRADQKFRIDKKDLSWKKISFLADGSLDFEAAFPDKKDEYILLSIPVQRLSEKDPHAILNMSPARKTKAWFNNQLIWECEEKNNLGLSYYNFPLPAEFNVIQLVMSSEGAGKVKMTVNAPEGSLSLL